MLHRRLAVWIVLISGTVIVPMTSLSGSARSRPEAASIVVTNTAELVAALAPHPGDLTIYVQRGTYLLNHPIVVPANTTVIGDGLMEYEADGLPTGFVPDSRTVIAAIAGVTGDFVSLRDGASLRGLVIQDVVRPGTTGGGVIAVASTAPGSVVSTEVTACEIVNPNPNAGAPTGPSGRGLLAITRDSVGGSASHEQSQVSVQLRQSIIRTPANGDGIFAINNASGSHIELHLRQNVIGKVAANGGVSRAGSTAGSTTLIESNGNLYRADVPGPGSGWNFNGGSDAPGAGAAAGATLNNKLTMHSVGDRLEGFPRAITLTGGQRMHALAGPISSNEVELILQDTRVASLTSDFFFRGASSIPAGVAAGDFNEVRVVMRNVTGSGPRTNDYINSILGTGNRLLFVGNLNAFRRTNQAISPAPGAQFFTAGR